MTHVPSTLLPALLIRVSLNGREIMDITVALICLGVVAVVVSGYRSK